MNQTQVSHIDTNKGIAYKLSGIIDVLRTEYTQNHTDPWIIAYSGGKDSTLLLQLVWEMLLTISSQDRLRKIYIVANDTLVESPLVIDHLKKSLRDINDAINKTDLPITTQITQPCVDQTFWVNVIGRGYIPPTRNFRWCTDRMKIQPTNQLIEDLTAKHKGAVLLVGTRRSESQNRQRRMQKHNVAANKLNPHSTISDCRMFSPLVDLLDNDVWMILMQRKPPWGGSHRELITLYRNAGGGECPLVLTQEDAPSCGTTSPRFGCWTCTVVQKDRSMRGTIDSGHPDQASLEMLFGFREVLVKLREDDANRMPVRRDGRTKTRDDGTRVFGPFTLEVRQWILDSLRKLESELGKQLITPAEVDVINDIWWRDRIQEEGRRAFIKKLN